MCVFSKWLAATLPEGRTPVECSPSPVDKFLNKYPEEVSGVSKESSTCCREEGDPLWVGIPLNCVHCVYGSCTGGGPLKVECPALLP